MFPGIAPTSSPTASQGAGGTRTLDTSPPMPPRQRRPPSVLFTPPMNENAGMGELGSDPMVQDMAASASVDKAFQTLAVNHPDAVGPLSELQNQFRQLIAALLASQSPSALGMMGGGMGGAGGVGGPNVVPPLPGPMGGPQGPAMGGGQ